jgi:hypothetical protein
VILAEKDLRILSYDLVQSLICRLNFCKIVNLVALIIS